MNLIQYLFLAILFSAIFIAALLALRLLSPSPIKDRLEALADPLVFKSQASSSYWLNRLISLVAPLAKLSVPEEGWEGSEIRTRFITAGWRKASTPRLYYAAKTGLFLGLPLIAYVYLHTKTTPPTLLMTLMVLLSAAAAGYYLPDKVLSYVVAQRQRDIFENFPDALDLMTVCVEAGLAMDSALARVANEIGLKSMVLAEEMQLVTLELRAGSSKDKALRNFAVRTGVEDVHSLVTMLIQAERFGTSIADSLRVQSEQLRTKRRQRAEEQAAKIALKLLFPLIFFIFPSLLVVLLGPAILLLSHGFGIASGASTP